MASTAFEVVGKRTRRKDGTARVTGREIYASDVSLPDMMYAIVLRSPHPHARIKRIDVSAAEAMGAVCLVPDDVPDVVYNERLVSIPARTYRDRTVLPKDKVRHVGEAVAAVAHDTEELALKALRAIRVEYEELPAVLDPHIAITDEAPAKLYERVFFGDEEVIVRNNIACERRIEVGNVEEGFAQADVIVEEEFVTQRQYHSQMEVKSVVCRPEPDGGITVWTTTQSIHNTRQLLGHIFSLPLNKVNVKGMALGGSFGSSIQTNSITPICVALALKARRPVKIVSSREEDMYDHVRYPMYARLKIGATRDGKLTAAHLKLLTDIGAHHIQAYSFLGVCAGWLASLYKFPHLLFEGTAAYTNKVPTCAMQGFGNPQVTFAVESLMDMLAEKLGMDPIELRRKNYVGLGDEFWGQGPTVRSIIKSCGVEAMLDRGMELIGWHRRKPAGSSTGDVLRGIGMARGFHTSGTGGPRPGEVIDYSSATVKINEDGSVDVITPVMDHGGGTLEAAQKIVAEVLKVPLEKVGVSPFDTRTTGYDVATHATRGVYCGGGAIEQVALRVKEQLLEMAGRILEQHPRDLVLERREDLGQAVVYPRGLPQHYVTVGQVAKTAQINGWGTMIASGSHRQKNCPPCFVTVFVEVEVERDTGKVRVTRAALLGDAGTPINPDLVEGQLLGGFYRGMAYALYEDNEHDPKTGLLKSRGYFVDYKVPGPCEMPSLDETFIELVHTYEPTGPFGAKGIAEACLNPVAAAIANAVYNATGVRFTKLPITPERVLEALQVGVTS